MFDKYNASKLVGNAINGLNVTILLSDNNKISKPVNPPTLLTKVTPTLFKFNVVTPSTKIAACNRPPFKLNAVILTEVAPKEVNHATNVA